MFRTLLVLVGLFSFTASAAIITINVGGDNTTASIQPQVDAFRAILGANNGAGGSFAGGRREVNWDGVPAGFSEPNLFPGNFFNVNSPRGIVSSAGPGGDMIIPTAQSDFAPFSNTKFFGLTGSATYTDAVFFLPGTSTPATVGGFGAIFLDADGDVATIEAFLADGTSAGVYDVADTTVISGGFSFLAIYGTAGEQFSRFRLTLGDGGAFGPNPTCDLDCVAVDDFIYGEPQAADSAVPEPSTLALIPAGLALFAALRRRK